MKQEKILHKFTLLPSYYEAAMKVPEDKRNEFIAAIFCYGLAGDEPEFSDPMLAAMFELVLPLIDQSVDYHRAKSDAGKQGGRGRKKVNKARESTPEQPESEIKQTKAKESKIKRESSLSLSPKGLGVQGEGAHSLPPPCRRLEDLTPGVVRTVAAELQVSEAFAAACLSRLTSYCRRKGKTYSDYREALKYFVTSDRYFSDNKLAPDTQPVPLPPKRPATEAEIAAMRAAMPSFLQSKKILMKGANNAT